MRIGRVRFELQYIVDLDDSDQVDIAKDYIIEDIGNAVKFNEEMSYIELVEDSSLSESDISQTITDCLTDEWELDDDLSAEALAKEDEKKAGDE